MMKMIATLNLRRGVLLPIALFALLSVELQAQTMENLADSASYAVGVNYATQTLAPVLEQLSSQGLALNHELVARAIADLIVEGRSALMPDSVVQATLLEFQKLHVAAISQTVKAQGELFLAENAKKEEVKVTSSGLQYTVIQKGTGASPTAKDSVQVRYRGFLLDAQVFDERMDSAGVTFRLDGVIKGWTEGLQMMKEGGMMRFFIPPNLAYGARSVGKLIRPNETLVFDVELVKVIPAGS